MSKAFHCLQVRLSAAAPRLASAVLGLAALRRANRSTHASGPGLFLSSLAGQRPGDAPRQRSRGCGRARHRGRCQRCAARHGRSASSSGSTTPALLTRGRRRGADICGHWPGERRAARRCASGVLPSGRPSRRGCGSVGELGGPGRGGACAGEGICTRDELQVRCGGGDAAGAAGRGPGRRLIAAGGWAPGSRV
jgi:hypothetical protein